MAALPDKNLVVDHNTVLCLNHFSNNDVAIYTHVQNEGGRLTAVKGCTPLIRQGAVPSVFPEVEDASSGQSAYHPEGMFHIASRDECPQTFADLDNSFESTDFLIDFYFLKESYKGRLKDLLVSWSHYSCETEVMFYTMDCAPVPRIVTSIKIDSNLILSMTLDGREMDRADLTWILPITGRINRWSQLKLLLKHFSKKQKTMVVQM